MEFKDAAERRAHLLARIEEVEKRRNAVMKSRVQRRTHRVRVREYVQANPGSTISLIAAALGLTTEQVWATQLQYTEFYQTSNRRGIERDQIRWWPETDQTV